MLPIDIDTAWRLSQDRIDRMSSDLRAIRRRSKRGRRPSSGLSPTSPRAS